MRKTGRRYVNLAMTARPRRKTEDLGMEESKNSNTWARLVAHSQLDDELDKGVVKYRYIDCPIGNFSAVLNLLSDKTESSKWSVLLFSIAVALFVWVLRIFSATCVIVLTCRWLAG